MTRKSRIPQHPEPQTTGPVVLDDAELDFIQGGGLLLPAVQAARESARSSSQAFSPDYNFKRISFHPHAGLP